MTEISKPGQMLWKPQGTTDCALHLRLKPSDPWRPYEEFPQYFLPDPNGFSKGYATFLALLRKGWTAEPIVR
jgi:hypothetical protein